MAALWGVQRIIRKHQGLVATALIWIGVGLILKSAAAETRNENRAHCKDTNPDLSIDGCTALIQIGRAHV